MKKSFKLLLGAVAVILLVVAGVIVGINWNNWFGSQEPEKEPQKIEDAQDWEGNKEEYTGEKNTDTIDIPGFDVMNMQAGVTEQKVNLYNPEQNNCYFKMSILLADGTKLWESNLVKPGKAVYNLALAEPLAAGTYEKSVLKYECFTLDENQSPLNGSEIEFTLNVIE
ncbi:MAG: tRNA (uracil-5-)-methyltransferase [Clostridia bacterium]|nr:tRNA (uracil-5-)-methyltransferase [Clostridia bacterium]